MKITVYTFNSIYLVYSYLGNYIYFHKYKDDVFLRKVLTDFLIGTAQITSVSDEPHSSTCS